MTFIYFDTETTGLEPYINDITELGAVLLNDDLTVSKETFHRRLLIQNRESATDEALEISHYNDALWEKTGVAAALGLADFNQWLQKVSPGDKPNIVATNAEFDKSFLYSNCDRFNIFPFVDNAWIDLIPIWVIYKHKHKLTHLGNSQEAICKHLGIENPKAHAALYDAVVGAGCFSRLTKTLTFGVASK